MHKISKCQHALMLVTEISPKPLVIRYYNLVLTIERRMLACQQGWVDYKIFVVRYKYCYFKKCSQL